ncbi:MAG: radical SAM family heme chaperone HemW [Halanaerobiales bacterium]
MSDIHHITNSFALYLHIPFCEGKCRYCDFYSVNYGSTQMTEYLECLKKEMLIYSSLINNEYTSIETIYIGGGTPGLLNTEQVSNILELIKKNFGKPSTGEITLEANPFSLTEEKISGYRKAGVNRISLGVQSFNNKELKFLGRKHSAEEAIKKVNMVRDYYDNFNIDLIFAIPGQAVEDWRYTLEKAVYLNPNHISLYNLQIEEDTPLATALSKGDFEEVDDSIDARMYILAREVLEGNGYNQYEISNFAREGYQSRHNRVYWELKPYLGLGPAAHGFTGSIRYNNYNDVYKYQETLSKVPDEIRSDKSGGSYTGLIGQGIHQGMDALTSQVLPIENIIELSKEDLMAERLFMGLRLLEGISLDDFFTEYGIRVEEYYADEIRKLRSRELIYLGEGRLKLTEKGLLFGNSVFMEFLPA